jgi:hypothetical protein
LRDAEKISSLDSVKKASETELNKLRTEFENINAIYFMGCRKLIREKQKMDWRDRNPNTIGRRRIKHTSRTYRREKMINNKVRSINEVLKDTDDINEAEIRTKSDRSERKRKLDKKKHKNHATDKETNSEEMEEMAQKRIENTSDKECKKIVVKRKGSDEKNKEPKEAKETKRKERPIEITTGMKKMRMSGINPEEPRMEREVEDQTCAEKKKRERE